MGKNPFWARKLFGGFDKSPGQRLKGGGFLKLYTLSGFGKPRLEADDCGKSCNFIRYVQKRDMKRFRKKTSLNISITISEIRKRVVLCFVE